MESYDRCAWYHLSSLDNDLMTFVKYLSCSLNKVIDSFNFNYDNHENLSGDKLIDSIANEFLIYLSQFSEYKISILLDDFQEISNDEVFEFLTILIRNTSDNIRLLMATKGSFPKFLARFIMNGIAVTINDKQLAFNRDSRDSKRVVKQYGYERAMGIYSLFENISQTGGSYIFSCVLLAGVQTGLYIVVIIIVSLALLFGIINLIRSRRVAAR